jgi:hypothetical protein
MSALRKTLMLFWILTLGMVAAFRYLMFSKLPSAIKRSATGARRQWEY